MLIILFFFIDNRFVSWIFFFLLILYSFRFVIWLVSSLSASFDCFIYWVYCVFMIKKFLLLIPFILRYYCSSFICFIDNRFVFWTIYFLLILDSFRFVIWLVSSLLALFAFCDSASSLDVVLKRIFLYFFVYQY